MGQSPEARKVLPMLQCPVCHGERWKELAPHDTHFKLFECCRCRTYHIDTKRPDASELYGEEYYSEESTRRLSGIFQTVWECVRRKRALRIARHASKGSRICDIGCERGELLNVLKQQGWEVYGTQLSRQASKFAREHFGIEVFVGELHAAPFLNKPFDVVLMIHVLEHLPDPEVYISRVYEMLCPEGIFWVEVPNGASFTARLCGKRWLHHDPEHHYWNFNKRNLVQLLNRYGFIVEACSHTSWEHAPIGCVQSWINFLPGPRNIIFQIVREGLSREPKRLALQILHSILAGLLLPAAFLVAGIESLLRNGQIIRVLARKTDHHKKL